MKTQTKKRATTVGARVEQLLSRERPLELEQVLEIVRREFGEVETSLGCLYWYAAKMRREGKRPNFKRKGGRVA